MKHLVNLIQLAIVLAILYPIYYVWDTDKVDNFCAMVKPGMSKKQLLKLADENGMSLIGPSDIGVDSGQWRASVAAKSSFSGYACVIKGAANSVATAEIIHQQ